MKPQNVLDKITGILDDVRAGVLATSDAEGGPCMRWMTPALLKGRPGTIFAITSPKFCKIDQVGKNPAVSWMFQKPGLDLVINVSGKMNVIDNPAMKAEIIERIGDKLTVFWKITGEDFSDYVILETVIETATVFYPMKGQKHTVSFREEDS